jgi:hypothetical protein
MIALQRRVLASLLMAMAFAPMLVTFGGCIHPHGTDQLIAGATSEPPKLVTDSSGHFRTRARWPVGSPLYVGFKPISVNASYGHSRSMRVRSELADSEEGSWFLRMTGPMYSLARTPWDDEMRLMGTPGRATSVVRLTRRLEKHRGKKGPAVISSGTSTLRVRVEGTVDDVLTPVELPDLDEAIAQRANAIFRRRGWGDIEQPYVAIAVHAGCKVDMDEEEPPAGLCPELARHPDVTFAARFEIMHRGEVVATARGWWRFSGWGVAPFENAVAVEGMGADVMERAPDDGQWSLRVASDPDTALRDLGSSRYWKGDVTVSLRVTDARNWEELKSKGEASTE